MLESHYIYRLNLYLFNGFKYISAFMHLHIYKRGKIVMHTHIQERKYCDAYTYICLYIFTRWLNLNFSALWYWHGNQIIIFLYICVCYIIKMKTWTLNLDCTCRDQFKFNQEVRPYRTISWSFLICVCCTTLSKSCVQIINHVLA